MNPQDTSLDAYFKDIYPNLAAKQRPVLHYLRTVGEPKTNAEISAAMHRPINEITPRIFELRKLGLVLDAGRRKCTVTGNAAHAWKAKYPVLPAAFPEKPKVEVNPQSLGI